MTTSPYAAPITPARCAKYADLLDAAIARLRAHEVRMSDASRLPIGVRKLGRTAESGTFPESQAARSALLAALRDAWEWHLITTSLGSGIEGELLDDIRRAVRGSLVPAPGEDMVALRFQAQLLFGAIMVQDGEGLGAPTTKGLPDFIIHDGQLLHGVEVKAPGSRSALRSVAQKADEQLAKLSGGGMLVLDASLIVQSELGSRETSEGTDDWLEERVRSSLAPIKTDLVNIVRRIGSWSSGRGIIATCIIARAQHWPMGGPASAIAIAWRRYYTTRGSLHFHRATMLGNRISNALRHLLPDLQVTWEE